MRDALKGITVLEIGVMTPGKFAGFLLVGRNYRRGPVAQPGQAIDDARSQHRGRARRRYAPPPHPANRQLANLPE
jgi:hypothetical protein|tara:strand:- start:76 stop:300 length:225 start_codon:yes stop_codon:yes gene_type:complete